MLRVLFVGIFILSCIVETQDALFTDGKSFQDIIDEQISKAMTKISKKLQDKLEVLKDNKYAIKLWKLYKKYYRKNYTSPDEEKERLGKFIDNLKIIIQENFRFDEGLKSFKLQLNQYGDMNLDEFRKTLTGLNEDGQGEKPAGDNIEQQMNQRMRRFLVDSVKKKIKKKLKEKLIPGYKKPSSSSKYSGAGYYASGTRINTITKRPTSPVAAKGTVDYRQYMNPVENQGRCGSCYAFAVTAAVEGTLAFKTGSKIKLSKQELIDCSSNNGCSGGYLGATLGYIKEHRGLQSDASYPYKTTQQSCKARSSKVGAIKGYGNTLRGDEEGMRQALATYGPLAAAIHTTTDLQFYGGSSSGRGAGIIDIPSCSKQVDHAIAIVGYGTENGKDYWLVRNSWGESWGLGGYFKIARNKNINAIFGSHEALNANQLLYKLLKQRSIDSDNEYVWFTRDIHDNFNDENMKPNHQQQIHNQFHLENPRKTFNPKHTVGENTL
ncbi:unnamed protein product [Rotaria magnacalcarata]|uniref:Uncharacterized protein n=5 Tax=Rotaria magnacalcarata TaxID=392030 RepID=A0A819E6Q9_9BILA|nr:unnamed protein product [Rotaria magnacalcarata]